LKHTLSSEAFIACGDPLEVAVISIMVEFLNRQEYVEEQINLDL
jgi:hypothetical protein